MDVKIESLMMGLKKMVAQVYLGNCYAQRNVPTHSNKIKKKVT